MCPLCMGKEIGGYFRSNDGVSPGKLMRNPCLIAFSKVDKVGENREACANAIFVLAVGVPMAPLA